MKNLIQKMIGMLLILTLLTGVVSIGFSAAAGELPAEVIQGTFSFLGTFDGSDPGEQTYYYSDDYFSTSGKTTNEHLRTMSGALAMLPRNTDGSAMPACSQLLSEIGFGNIQADDMDQNGINTIGSILSCKEINGQPVVLVQMRGDNYALEWASNLVAGASGDAAGLAAAAATVSGRVKNYLTANNLDNVKFWVVGYSRGGAVANLLGKAINEDLSAYHTTADDLYVYTFEAPNCSTDPTVYENIHNVCDCRDVITYVYPQAWGFCLNGVKEEIGDPDTTITLKEFELLSASLKDAGEIKAADFLQQFTDYLGTQLPRNTYLEQIQTSATQMLGMVFSMSEQAIASLRPYGEAVLNNIKSDPNLMLAAAQLLFGVDEEKINALAQIVINAMDKANEEVGNPFAEGYQMITQTIPTMLKVMVPVVLANLQAEMTDAYGKIKSLILPMLSTFAGNVGQILSYHYNYNVYRNLKANDSYYIFLGDANEDETVDIIDVTTILRHDAKMSEIAKTALDRSDVDRDNEISVIDATMIQRYCAALKAPAAIDTRYLL